MDMLISSWSESLEITFTDKAGPGSYNHPGSSEKQLFLFPRMMKIIRNPPEQLPSSDFMQFLNWTGWREGGGRRNPV